MFFQLKGKILRPDIQTEYRDSGFFTIIYFKKSESILTTSAIINSHAGGVRCCSCLRIEFKDNNEKSCS